MEKEAFFEKLHQNPRPVVVDIWAPWCMPCRAIAPSLESLGGQFDGRVDYWKVNADESLDLVQSLGVRSIPTVIAFRGGQEVARRIGAQPKIALGELFEAALTGAVQFEPGLAPLQRMLRLIAGVGLLILGWQAGPSIILLAVSGVVLFSAVYDRCPVWRALSPRLARLFHRPQATQVK